MTFKARNDIHIARRIWHFCGVLAIFALYWIMDRPRAVVVALSVSSIMIGFDVARLFLPRLNRLFTWIFGAVLRESERRKISGATSMLAGVTLVVLIFPKTVGLLSLLFLAVADPLASYFGIRYGKDKLIGDKSLQGTMAAFVACFVITIAYCLAFNIMRERLFIVSVLAGLIGAVSELLPIFRLDDNFVFPVVSSTLLTALFYVFGGLT